MQASSQISQTVEWSDLLYSAHSGQILRQKSSDFPLKVTFLLNSFKILK